MAGKDINDMSDEEIDALDPAELLALQTGDAPGADGEEEEQEEEEQGGDDKGGEDGAEGGGEGGDAAGGDDDAEAERARLAKLADEQEEEEEEVEGQDANGMIPRSRYNERNAEAKSWKEVALGLLADRTPGEKPAAVVDEPAPARPVYDFKAANREYHKLLTEGEDEKAATKLDEIEDKRAELHTFDLAQARAEAETSAVQRISQAQLKREIASTETALYEKYPFLNNKSKSLDADAILAVNAKARQLIQGGKDAVTALREAGESIGKRFAKLNGISDKPADSKAGDGKGKVPADGSDKRTQGAVRRGLEVRQPATQKSGVGNREQLSKLDISEMTDEQIEKLEKSDPAALAELRGDNRIPA